MVKKTWRTLAAMVAVAFISACATSEPPPSTETSSTGGDTTTTTSTGAGGDGGSGGASVCGDGIVTDDETCDDTNTEAGDGCDGACAVEVGWECDGAPSECAVPCGDGIVAGVEACDDANLDVGDGCSDDCDEEPGWHCMGNPSACFTACGDGVIAIEEECDDGNPDAGDGCSDLCLVELGYSCILQPSVCSTGCGDGIVAGAEECDDDNNTDLDGCGAACVVEGSFTCSGSPSVCETTCGDGFVKGVEECDDANAVLGDGCDNGCKGEAGWVCSGEPSVCEASCGQGLLSGAEECDDGNLVNGDGCNFICKVEPGWLCDGGSPTDCETGCGDGFPTGTEGCDDGNLLDGDGCNDDCVIETGYVCFNIPSVCVTVCGDGVIGGSEECDDGDASGNDGCSASCQVEAGFTCSGLPSDCVATCGDGIKAFVELCDDGNTTDGDCCSASCIPEPGCEVEPNGSTPEANSFAAVSIANVVKGSIRPAGDSDYFRLTVPVGVSGALTAETKDGYIVPNCANLTQNSFISIYNSGFVLIASDDNTGVGNCALASIVGLPPGDYFIRVHSNIVGAMFEYTLQVGLQLVTCGDGIKGPGEQCDDGNTMPGDGCSATCVLETIAEIEPNDIIGDAFANGPFPVGELLAGSIGPSQADSDYFAFEVTSTSDVRIETFDGTGPMNCVGLSTILELRSATDMLLATDNIDGPGNCSLINPTTDIGARHLLPGTYFARVRTVTNLIPAYTLFISFTTTCGNGLVEGFEECDGGPACDINCDRIAVCGDGYIDAPETCDDFNVIDGDGCSSTCQEEGLITEVEPNGTFAEADASPIQLSGTANIVAAIGVVGDKDHFKLNVATDSVIRFETFDATGYDCFGAATTVTLRLFNAIGTQLYTDATSGIGSCSAITANVLAGTYYVAVEETGNNAMLAGYRLRVTFPNNGGAETEPNATAAAASAIPAVGLADVYVFGGHQLNADVDYFSVNVPPGKSLRAEVIEGSAAETCESNGIDAYLELRSPADAFILLDDDGGRGFCSLIDGTGAAPFYPLAHNLAGGIYHLRLYSASATASGVFDYRLVVTIR
jgi:cysteine-rich repeat protein